jgi:hypothetical protein
VEAHTTIHSGRQTRPWFILCQLKKIQNAPCINPAPSAYVSAAVSIAAGRCGDVSTTFNIALALHEKNGARILAGAAFSGEVGVVAAGCSGGRGLREPGRLQNPRNKPAAKAGLSFAGFLWALRPCEKGGETKQGAWLIAKRGAM